MPAQRFYDENCDDGGSGADFVNIVSRVGAMFINVLILYSGVEDFGAGLL